MEFEELQKIWIAERQESVYAIDEKALHQRIASKKRSTLHITNVSELLLIVVNLGAGGFVFGMNVSGTHQHVFPYIMAAWMLLTAFYVLVKRVRRLHEPPPFDRSMREDLRHAVATARYQVRLSYIMRLDVLPIGLLSALSIWEGGKSVWFVVGILFFFALLYYISGWEHGFYQRRKRELELLYSKLEQD